MKQYFLNAFLVAAVATVAVPVFAQQESAKSDKKNKGTQTIVITRTGDTDEKTVIEVVGDKVLVNGKENNKNSNVKVNVHSYTPGVYSKAVNGTGGSSFIYNESSFFTEDSNRAMLGIITDQDDKGAEITSITKESAAEKAGLKKGDIITQIGSKKVETTEDVSEAIRSHKPGDKVAISVLRDGKEQKLNAEMGKWKGMKINTITAPRVQMDDVHFDFPSKTMSGTNFSYSYPYGSNLKLGLSIQDTEDSKGVKVTGVDDESNAAKAGIKENDIITHVNDKEVTAADEVSRAVRENKDKGPLRFQITRDGKSQNIEVRFPKKLKTANL
jgi:serine protease Do